MKISSVSRLLVACLFLVSLIVITSTVLNLSYTTSIEDTWHDFNRHRSEKKLAYNALKIEMGFGGMIHAFKNYLLRNELADQQQLTESIGGAMAAIKRYRLTHLSVSEKKSLNNIEATLLRYKAAANSLTKILSQKKYSLESLDAAALVGDEEAFHAFALLSTEGNIEHNSFISPKHSDKEALLDEMIDSLGYGGFIHQYKDFVIRRKAHYQHKALSSITKINASIRNYQAYEMSPDEAAALAVIKKTVSQYKTNLSVIDKMIQQGEASKNIDRQVRVDNVVLLAAIYKLKNIGFIQNEERSRALEKELEQLILINEGSAIAILILMLAMLLGFVWTLRFKIIKPINKLNKVMNNLSQGDYSAVNFGDGLKNEIGEMAQSVRVFRNNMIQRDEFESKLRDVNIELEQRVEDRTRELSQKTEILKSVLDTAADAIVTIDSKGIILSFNAAAVSIFGYQSEQVCGQNVKMLMPEPYHSEHDSYLKRYADTAKKNVIDRRVQVTGLRSNQQNFPMELAISEVESGDEKIFTGIVHDLTDLKKVENQLREAKEEAEKANQVKSEFLSSMSHELRTPLNSILGFTQILELDKENFSQSNLELIKEIKGSGAHLLSLISEILDLVRIEAGSYQLNLQPVYIAEIVQQVMDELEAEAGDKNISILKPELDVCVLAEGLRLKQVFKHLLSNAIKYIQDNGIVKIIYDLRDDNRIRISIVDNGPGLSEWKLERLFIPFERFEASCSEIEGTGIGLVACKRLVKLMDGTIGVESEENMGSTFWFELKLDDVQQSLGKVKDDKKMNSEDKHIVRRRNILYIEDNLTNLKVVEKWFSKTTDFQLISATNAKDGLIMLEQSKPDLVLLDINLPGMNGYEALKIIRDNNDYADLPVIAVTANAMVDDIERGLEAGFNSYLTKPIDLDELVRAINILLH
ncbi:MAG: PAS domain S-box protein [Gammaproteobacteria bacterium]|nr:PAS domain S-box protein [Gammaproteobacteria bacterium]